MINDPHFYGAVTDCARQIGLQPAQDLFLFLRHGRTEGNRRQIFQHPNDPLNADGHEDAAQAAQILRHHAFGAIYASTMARAWLTAGHVAATTAKPVFPVPQLRERYFGDLIGTSSATVDWRDAPPGGETLDEFVQRTLAGAAQVIATAPHPLLVAHNGNLRVIAGALGIALDPSLTHNAVPLRFERRDGMWRVHQLTTP